MRNICFFKILRFTIYFFIIFYILFLISPIRTCQKILEIFMFFYFMDQRFIKEFWKIMEYFSKKYRHLKSKILHKFHYLLFVFFYFFSILVIFFFPISPIQTCQKILKIFVVLDCTDYIFYHIILENSSIFVKKKIEIL